MQKVPPLPEQRPLKTPVQGDDKKLLRDSSATADKTYYQTAGKLTVDQRKHIRSNSSLSQRVLQTQTQTQIRIVSEEPPVNTTPNCLFPGQMQMNREQSQQNRFFNLQEHI